MPGAVCRGKLLHRAGPPHAGRRYDDGRINYPIGVVGLFPVSGVDDAEHRATLVRERRSAGRAKCSSAYCHGDYARRWISYL